MLKTLVFLTGSLVPALLGTHAAHAASRYQDAVIEDTKVTPENAGINPDAFSYLVEAKVLAGSNACTATGVKIQLKKRISVGALNLVAQKRLPQGPRPMCIQIWQPVYKIVKTRVTGLRSRTGKIFVHNLGEIGSVKTFDQLLQSGQAISVKGTMTRVMAIGGETTGFAVMTANGDYVEVDLKTNGFHLHFADFEDRAVVVSGRMTKKTGIEIPVRNVLVAEDLRVID
jgi:hypothetical protein